MPKFKAAFTTKGASSSYELQELNEEVFDSLGYAQQILTNLMLALAVEPEVAKSKTGYLFLTKECLVSLESALF